MGRAQNEQNEPPRAQLGGPRLFSLARAPHMGNMGHGAGTIPHMHANACDYKLIQSHIRYSYISHTSGTREPSSPSPSLLPYQAHLSFCACAALFAKISANAAASPAALLASGGGDPFFKRFLPDVDGSAGSGSRTRDFQFTWNACGYVPVAFEYLHLRMIWPRDPW